VLFNGAIRYLYNENVDHVDKINVIRGLNDGKLSISIFLQHADLYSSSRHRHQH
jgi:hypothetical protein